MEDQDRIAAKLKGFNAYVKLVDDEIIFLKVEDLDGDEDDAVSWFEDTEKFINSNRTGDTFDHFPEPGIALNRSSIKYIRAL